MAILIDRATRALIQGITGEVGSFQAKIMQEYGTQIVAGVTPGKGGKEIYGIPVFDFVDDAVAQCGANAALSFAPAPSAAEAAMEAIDAGIPLVVVMAEGVPDRDMLAVIHSARLRGVRIIGPDTPGVISPGKCKLGVHPGRMFVEGWLGVVSKSGALSYEVCKNLTQRRLGQSTVVGIGGGPLWGMRQVEVLRLFQDDPATRVVVLLGEVGGTMEQEAARYIRSEMDKPVVAMIVGRSAPRGSQMGHAGAIVEGDEGLALSKIDALKDAGAQIAHSPAELVDLVEFAGG
jgi:succinyl-CoA synthetase alpha subunit